jgi:hypothetical protein
MPYERIIVANMPCQYRLDVTQQISVRQWMALILAACLLANALKLYHVRMCSLN